MNNQPLLEFNIKLPKLSQNESKVLKLLVEAGKLIVPIYLEQEKQLAQKISKEEIEKAAKKDPAILSPFTVVEKVDGKIVATPYHVKYAKLLKPVVDKLVEASKLSGNKGFARFLKLQAKALMDGSYEQATATWLKMKPYILDISIGPVEHFDSQLFYAKAAYQCWVGVIESEGTKRLNNYKNIVLKARRNAVIPGERIDNYEHVKAKTIDLVLLSGLMARTQFVGINLPKNLEVFRKYGSEVTIFNQTNDTRMKEQIIPMFNKIFSSEFRNGFDLEDLRRGSLRYVALHELAHAYLYYKHAFSNLQDLLPVIYELAATLLGMRIAGILLLKDRITTKQLESMIVAFICRSLYLMEKSKKNKSIINYAVGGAIFINYMLETDALKQYKGLAIPNFMKIFVSIHDLAYNLEYMLASGKRKDAEALINKYGKFKNTSFNSLN